MFDAGERWRRLYKFYERRAFQREEVILTHGFGHIRIAAGQNFRQRMRDRNIMRRRLALLF